MHHAYVYEGSLSEFEALVEDAREQLGFAAEHSPDVHVRVFEKFGIEESRWLASMAALRPASGRALFMLGISAITSEAQQALLKLLEEPQAGVVFVLLVPHGVLLPTVRSRVQMWKNTNLHQGEPLVKEVVTFLKASGKERSDMIAKLLKDEEGLKDRVRDFVNGLEAEVARFNLAEKRTREALADIAMVRNYLGDRSPSLKMLLEHLALALPVVEK